MLNKEEIEGFLDRLAADGASYKEIQPGLWVVKPGGSLDFDVVVHFSPPVVILRVKVMEWPKDRNAQAQLSRRLLEMNASEMVHGSYGIEQNAVVITEALELNHLDFEEFLAAYESIALALASHLREIGNLGTSGTHRAVTRVDGKKPVRTGNSKKNARSTSGAKAKRGAKPVARRTGKGRR